MTRQFRTDPEAALAGYRERGFHVEHGVFSEAECDEVVDHANRLECPERAGSLPVMHPHRVDAFFLGPLRNPRVVAIMERLVGGRVSGVQTQFFYCRPGTRGFSAHQDNHFVRAGREVFASVWCAMTDVRRDNGGLFVFPGTHREPVLPTRPFEGEVGPYQDPNARNVESIVPPRYEAEDVELSKGSVLFLHGHAVHASHDNRSTDFRYALLCTYIRSGEPFRAGHQARRVEIPIYEDTASRAL